MSNSQVAYKVWAVFQYDAITNFDDAINVVAIVLNMTPVEVTECWEHFRLHDERGILIPH